MKKRFLMTGVAIVLALSMAGCGKSSSETTTENATSEEVAEDTEEVTTEEEDTSWFSENNISFTEGEVSIPAYAYSQKDDGTFDDRVEITQKEATYSEPVISASEVDSDGNITYTVTCKIRGTWSAMMPVSIDYFNFRCNLCSYEFVDAYTGTVLPCAGLKDDDSYATESIVEVDGNEYKILTSASSEWNWNEPSYSEFDDNMRASVGYTVTVTKTAVVPAEYDGLILYMNGNGKTEYDEIDTEVEEAHPFDGDIATAIFKDVTYGVALEQKAAGTFWIAQNNKIHIQVNSDGINIDFHDLVDEEETKAEGYITINLKDGTSIQVQNIEYNEGIDSANNKFSMIYGYGDSLIQPTQIESVVVGGKVYSDGEIENLQ